MAPITRLEELHLADNNITDAGALDLAKACMDSTSIHWLTVTGNRMTWKGIQTLSLFLPNEFVLESDQQKLT